MKLKQSLIVAIVLVIIGALSWELYWRSQGLHPTLNDEKALWAITRDKVETYFFQQPILKPFPGKDRKQKWTSIMIELMHKG